MTNSGVTKNSYDYIKLSILAVMILIFLITCSSPHEDVPEIIKMSVWAAPAEQKIRPDDNVEENNIVWSNVVKKISVAGAANEHVPFQVVISLNESNNQKDIKTPDGLFVEVTNLISEEGNIIQSENIELYLEHFIMLDAKSSPVGDTGYWPDALVPLKVPFNMTAQNEVVRNRPVWIDIFIPKGTNGGKYTGNIYVSQYGKNIDSLSLEADVYNFSLPEETPLITYMNISRWQLARFYNKPNNSVEIEKLTQVYYDKLYASRMEPWFNDMLTPNVKVIGNEVELVIDDDKYNYFLNDLKTKRVLLHAFPGSLAEQILAEPFTNEFNQIVKSYLSQVELYFQQNGWHDKLVFNCPIDEPRTLKDYEDTRKWASLVKEATTDVPFLVTRTPVPPRDNPEWGSFKGYVDNYSIHGNHLNDPELIGIIDEIKKDGGELTWYISCDQGYPQPNYFIDAPAMDLIMVPWITAKYNLDGILYWALNWWSDTPNPWINANTFSTGKDCSGGWTLNGEGSVLYPGDYVYSYTGQPNIVGPVTSIRFELLREGIEDYLYLYMLEKMGDSAFHKEQIDKLVTDVKSFSRDVNQLYTVRKAMSERIETLF